MQPDISDSGGPMRCAASRPIRRNCWIVVLGAALSLGAAAGSGAAEGPAQAGRSAEEEEDAVARRLRELEARIGRLLAQVERLRAAAAGSAAVAELEKRIEALAREIERLKIGAAAAPEAEESILGLGPAASKIYKLNRGVSIGGYGEMLYQNLDSRRDDGTTSAATDRLDFLRAVFYFGYKFNDRFLFNSEIEFEHAVAGDGEAGEVAVEFAYIDFRASRRFGARGGLLLIPMGFLNELHEPPIFHGARRPEVERFIIPTTWRENGVGVYGEAGPVSYRAYVVASLDARGFTAEEGIRGGRQNGSRSAAEDLAVTARLDYSPVPGVLLGASAFTGRTGQGDPARGGARITLWDAHAEWGWRGLRLRGLYATSELDDADRVSAANPDTVGEEARGWYAEIAWNVLAPAGRTGQDLSPFFRYEAYDTQHRVAPGFAADPANDRSSAPWG
ncbi:MAG: hypothetical protein ACE5JH_06915 [Acidobacteriota bacterium]